jgi:hypothetical protein
MNLEFRCFCFLTLLLVSITTQGQHSVEKIFVKGDFLNKPLGEWIKELEAAHDVQFQYVDEIVNGVILNGMFKYKTPLPEAIAVLLGDTKISFTVYEGNQIVFFINERKELKKTVKLFKLSGYVLGKGSAQPIPFAAVQLLGLTKTAITDDLGKFTIKPLPSGTYLLRVTSIGFAPAIRKITVDDDVQLSIPMEESASELKEIVITPSLFEISSVEASPLVIGKSEILHSPNMNKDVYRTLRTLPGIANSDFSAKARIRGGHSDETAVYFDHFLINDAFHLEEVDGSFSIFNTDYVDEITVLTGGFSAKYTDRLSGIVDVKSFDNLETDKYSFSADLLNMSVVGQKKLSNSVNLSMAARRGYLDLLLKKMGALDVNELDPKYSDFWTKLSYKVNERNHLSLNLLLAHDNFVVRDQDKMAAHLNVNNVRFNGNGWVNWKWFPGSSCNSITTLGWQQLKKNADFLFADNVDRTSTENKNNDINSSSSISLTNNTYWDVNEHHAFEFGGEVRAIGSAYHYRERRYEVFNSTPDNVVIRDIDLNENFDGYTAGAYLQYNYIVGQKLIVQPALRASTQSFSSKVNWAPKFAVSFKFLPSFTAKLAYGVYYQPDLYYKMRTSLMQEKPYSEVGRATHYTGSLNYSFKSTNVMFSVYHKEYNFLFDDYRFEFYNRMGAVNILDVPFNTTSGQSRGLEIMLRQNYAAKSTLSVSYAYAKSTIVNAAGKVAPRDFDQPHTIIVNNTFRLPEDWNISLLWNYHTGYPYTPTSVDFIQYRPTTDGIVLFYAAEEKNSKRLPDHHSLDIRMEKSWHIGKSVVCAYMNIVNFYNRSNVRSYWWVPVRDRNNTITFEHERQWNIPFFVSPGITITFY